MLWASQRRSLMMMMMMMRRLEWGLPPVLKLEKVYTDVYEDNAHTSLAYSSSCCSFHISNNCICLWPHTTPCDLSYPPLLCCPRFGLFTVVPLRHQTVKASCVLQRRVNLLSLLLNGAGPDLRHFSSIHRCYHLLPALTFREWVSDRLWHRFDWCSFHVHFDLLGLTTCQCVTGPRYEVLKQKKKQKQARKQTSESKQKH